MRARKLALLRQGFSDDCGLWTACTRIWPSRRTNSDRVFPTMRERGDVVTVRRRLADVPLYVMDAVVLVLLCAWIIGAQMWA